MDSMWGVMGGNALVQEHMDYDVEEQAYHIAQWKNLANVEQRAAFDAAVTVVE